MPVHWTDDAPITVGDLRRVMADLPDDAPVFVDGHPDRPLVGALTADCIPNEHIATWQQGDPLVLGLELWLGDDDFFPAPRCQHSTRSARPTAKDA